MATQANPETCPDCGARITDTIGASGPGSGVRTGQAPELTTERAMCPNCSIELERPLLGGPHPWQRLPETPQYDRA